MQKIVFYEKSGCGGNARQKALLKSYGVEFEVKNLLETPWKKEELEKYFFSLEVKDFINPFAPKVKKGEIDTNRLLRQDAIEMMIKEPILIKRPLIKIDDLYLCGFDTQRLNELLHIEIDLDRDINSCQSSDSCKSV